MTLSEDFLAPYTEKAPPWGFDGLGYIVFKRTYARTLDEKEHTPRSGGRPFAGWLTVPRPLVLG